MYLIGTPVVDSIQWYKLFIFQTIEDITHRSNLTTTSKITFKPDED